MLPYRSDFLSLRSVRQILYALIQDLNSSVAAALSMSDFWVVYAGRGTFAKVPLPVPLSSKTLKLGYDLIISFAFYV